MEQHWICRDYQPGDEGQILTLFKRVFRQDMSLATWKWHFIENPAGKGIIKLMFDKGQIIGHYAVIPMNLQMAKRYVKAVFSMTTMTHPEYSGRGIFTFLAEEVYKSCAQQGVTLVYGFPNDNSYPGFTKKLGWEGLGKTVILYKNLDKDSGYFSIHGDIQSPKRFDNRIDILWNKVRDNYTVIVPRIAEYLNWRYTNNPNVQYKNYMLMDKRDQVLGYIVLKLYIQSEIKKGHIVDLLSINDEEVIRTLVKKSYAYFRSKQIYNVSGWFSSDSQYYSVMKQEGFMEADDGQNFGLRVFDKDSNPELIKGHLLSDWHLTMGDSDVF